MVETMIKRLYNAQDNDEELRFGIYGKGISIVVTIIPDVMEVGRWFEISDKEKGFGTLLSFRIDSDVEYDGYGVYSFKSGELTVEVGELN